MGFIVTFQRGAEWAASGKVTQPVPIDFPNGAGVSLRPDYKEITLEEDISGLINYEVGKSTKYFTDLQSRIRGSSGNAAELLKYEKLMVKALNTKETTSEAKKLILRELSWMGSDYCVSAVKELAKNAELKDVAEYALERLKPAPFLPVRK